MALALEVPVDMSTRGANHNGEPVRDEHLNLVRDYQVELHTKLVDSEENRAHMSSYINFEEDAPGDDEILGETDMDYFIDDKDTYLADTKASAGTEKSTLQAKGEGKPSPASQRERQGHKTLKSPETLTETLAETLGRPETLAETLERHKTLTETLAKPKTLAETLVRYKTLTETLAQPKTLSETLVKPKTLAETLPQSKTLAKIVVRYPRSGIHHEEH